MNYASNVLHQNESQQYFIIYYNICVRFLYTYVVVVLLVGYAPTSPRAGTKRQSPEHQSDASGIDRKKLRVPEADKTDLKQTSGKLANPMNCQQYAETRKTPRQAYYMYFVTNLLR